MGQEKDLAARFIEDIVKRFENVKSLGDGALAQLEDEELFFTLDPESNSIAIQIQHLHGNMMSRWTDFLSSDGEKPWRERDAEFEAQDVSGAELRQRWEAGWACLFAALGPLRPDDLLRTIYIREQPVSVLDAILRQLAHLSYHAGQIVLLAKHLRGPEWRTLSIARGQSRQYQARPRD
ncbi:MAG: DUF1572 family protein [Candidatus Hydrogenedentes bacterium]|nr:DUF1572 family protein [Candidatus Hydrogenedentota bacterium]MBI3117150.1 DUF1572 family protein [Candidatus Hydrogenedentota bacterium]